MRIELTTISLQGSSASLGTCEPKIECFDFQWCATHFSVSVHQELLDTDAGACGQQALLPLLHYIHTRNGFFIWRISNSRGLNCTETICLEPFS